MPESVEIPAPVSTVTRGAPVASGLLVVARPTGSTVRRAPPRSPDLCRAETLPPVLEVGHDARPDGLPDLAGEREGRVRRALGADAGLPLAVLDRVGLEGPGHRVEHAHADADDEQADEAIGMRVPATRTIRLPPMVVTHATRKPRFLPSRRVIAGPKGPTYSTAPVVMIVTTARSAPVPLRL